MKKKKVTMKQLQRKRDAYLIEAQERMIVQREKEIYALEGEIKAAHMWIAHLLDRLAGDSDEIALSKEEITKANPIAFEYTDDGDQILVRRVKKEEKE